MVEVFITNDSGMLVSLSLIWVANYLYTFDCVSVDALTLYGFSYMSYLDAMHLYNNIRSSIF